MLDENYNIKVVSQQLIPSYHSNLFSYLSKMLSLSFGVDWFRRCKEGERTSAGGWSATIEAKCGWRGRRQSSEWLRWGHDVNAFGWRHGSQRHPRWHHELLGARNDLKPVSVPIDWSVGTWLHYLQDGHRIGAIHWHSELHRLPQDQQSWDRVAHSTVNWPSLPRPHRQTNCIRSVAATWSVKHDTIENASLLPVNQLQLRHDKAWHPKSGPRNRTHGDPSATRHQRSRSDASLIPICTGRAR